jgi:hypothetical protein
VSVSASPPATSNFDVGKHRKKFIDGMAARSARSRRAVNVIIDGASATMFFKPDGSLSLNRAVSICVCCTA